MNTYDLFPIGFLIFETTKDGEQWRKRKLFQTGLPGGLFATIISGCLNPVVKTCENLIFFNQDFIRAKS